MAWSHWEKTIREAKEKTGRRYYKNSWKNWMSIARDRQKREQDGIESHRFHPCRSNVGPNPQSLVVVPASPCSGTHIPLNRLERINYECKYIAADKQEHWNNTADQEIAKGSVRGKKDSSPSKHDVRSIIKYMLRRAKQTGEQDSAKERVYTIYKEPTGVDAYLPYSSFYGYSDLARDLINTEINAKLQAYCEDFAVRICSARALFKPRTGCEKLRLPHASTRGIRRKLLWREACADLLNDTSLAKSVRRFTSLRTGLTALAAQEAESQKEVSDKDNAGPCLDSKDR
ncbi:hypothetical protein EVAR_36299_1 [Eumeta japonica]|uniref:Uncharacterized protein n=1 Tax=Eumeta variegata TaxID=151549 RepID=A0A4C1VJ77_EUMVA|nr:hypothetical protein EVAR_36299_1 [Eumeta japonica]